MLLKLVLTTSPHPFGSLFSEFGGHGDKLGTRPSVIWYLAQLCKGAKLKVEAGTSLICQRCGGITSSNAIAFTGGGAKDMQADLFK